VDALRGKLHARGMRLMVDFVPNHTGPDHVWIASHPEYFLQGHEEDFHRDPAAFLLIEPEGASPLYIARGRDPYFAPWADTAQLDYFNPATRAAMIGVLKEIGRHADGVRCDMSMLVLNEIFARTWGALLRGRRSPQGEFWTDATAALPSDFLWMAEVYWGMEGALQALGFQYTYDKVLYDRLKGDAAGVRAHLSADIAWQNRMARFLENHDEERSVTAYGRERMPALIVLIATLPGLRFYHQGQFEGLSMHLPMPLNAAKPEAPDRTLAAQYAKVLHLTDDPVFHEGEWKSIDVAADSDTSNASLLAWRWKSASDYRLVIVNLGGGIAQGRVRIAHDVPGGADLELTDALDGLIYERSRADLDAHGLYVRLAPHRAHLFIVKA
jgi:glycosidase